MFPVKYELSLQMLYVRNVLVSFSPNVLPTKLKN
jgi:hypothetical protein